MDSRKRRNDPSYWRSLIQANEHSLNVARSEISITYSRRSQGPREWERWEAACANWHRSYDSLAFPGGLDAGLERLKEAAPDYVEAAIAFLEVDPWFHRSGYIKETLNRRLKHVPLTRQHQVRLQAVIENRILGPGVREFRTYCGLAAVVADEAFMRCVRELAASEDRRTARHARWVLESIEAVGKMSEAAARRANG